MAESNQIIGFVKWCLKWIGIAITSLVVISLVIWGGVTGYDHYTQGRHEEKIAVHILNDPTYTDKESGEEERVCSDDHPIFIQYDNNSSRTVEKIWIDVEARLPGRSTNILRYNANAKSDYITPPGETWANCWRFPINDEYKDHSELKEAEYSGKISMVSFADEETHRNDSRKIVPK